MASAVDSKDKRGGEAPVAAAIRPGPGRPSATPLVGLPSHATRSQVPGGGSTGGILVIGREIEVKGEIGCCQTLVVEGRLEAAVEVGSLQLAEDGIFDGKAEVETAEIAGHFIGDLIVKGELLLRPTARVEGKTRYSRIVIEGGGEISGDVAVLPEKARKQVAEA